LQRPSRLPESLAKLGFVARIISDVEVIEPPLCEVPSGEFLMGSDPQRIRGAHDNEKPQHRVTLAAFQIGRYLITVAEYACAVAAKAVREPSGSDSWQTQLGRLDHPVVDVSWEDAVDYARWLAKVTGRPWRLPSEAEWEQAARGTDGRSYPWGDTFHKARCNLYEDGIRKTTPVGSFPSGASPYGVQDMTGNVWEWTSGLYMSYPYRPDDGREREDSTDYRVPHRVVRGGSWLNGDAKFARTACQLGYWFDSRSDDRGFRLALAPV
jgi:formylglycine-generating enzyme required for sulfatase activity